MNLPRFALALLALQLSACAALPGEPDARDRFERINRPVYRFNDALDRGLAKPVARAYVKITPEPLRAGVGNFFENLTYPTTVVNDLLQAKPLAFVRDTARLIVNTSIGIGGLFDPATKMGLPSSDEDFGQTLGRWGVPAGPYLMLPILGPSSARDIVGEVGDHYTDPKTYFNNSIVRYGLTAGQLLSKRAALLPTDAVLTNSHDPYAFIRNAYLQRRQFQVRDGAVETDDVEIFEDETQGTATP
jgi:phospholipid-binding lipoprotein MlaA